MDLIYTLAGAILLVWPLLGLGCWDSNGSDGHCIRPWAGSKAEEVVRRENGYDEGIVDLVNPAVLTKRLNLTNTTVEGGEECPKTHAEKLGQSGGVGGKDQLADHDYVDHPLEEDTNTNVAGMKEQSGGGRAVPAPPDESRQFVTFEEFTKERLRGGVNGRALPAGSGDAVSSESSKTPLSSNQSIQILAVVNESLSPPSHPSYIAEVMKPAERQSVPVEGVQQAQDKPKAADYVSNRNYASRECGAKVLESNDESENKAAVLNDKERDDYMRNPCEKAREKFLIVELCDSIRLTDFEVANFELFSSGPKAMRLWASERYPTAEWSLVGEFEAENTREIQSFPISTHMSFAKFIKLELVTHHGQEHYCTLSIIRAYGVDEWKATFNNEEPQQKQTTEMPPENPIESIVASTEGSAVTLNADKGAPTKVSGAEHSTTEQSTEYRSAAESNNVGNPVEGVIKSVIDNIISHIEVLPKSLLSGIGNNSTRGMPRRLFDECQQCDLTDRRRGKSRWLCYAFTNNYNYSTMHLNKVAASASEARMKRTAWTKYTADTCGMTSSQRSFLKRMSARKSTVNNCTLHVREFPKKQVIEPSSHEKEPQAEAESGSAAPPQLPSAIEATSLHKHTHKSTVNNDTPLPGATTNQKEKALMTLHKRLTALELNMSLSQEYLNELSRRYVAQSETWAKQHELLLKNAEDAAAEVVRRHERPLREEVVALRTDLEVLRAELLKHGALFKSMRSAMMARLIGPTSPSSKSLIVRTASQTDAGGKSCNMEADQGEKQEPPSPARPDDFAMHNWTVIVATLGSQMVVILLVSICVVLWRRCSTTVGSEQGAMLEAEVKELVRQECEKAVANAIVKLSGIQRLRLPDDGKTARRRKQRRPVHTPVPQLAVDKQSICGGQPSLLAEESGDSAVETATNSSSLTISSRSSVHGVASATHTLQQPQRLGSELEASELEAYHTLHQPDTVPIHRTEARLSTTSLVEATSVDGRQGAGSGGSIWQLVGKARRKLSADNQATNRLPPTNKTIARSQPRPLARCPEERK